MLNTDSSVEVNVASIWANLEYFQGKKSLQSHGIEEKIY